MKCIQYTDGRIVRVSDMFAEIDVKNGSAKYICKKVWKEATRPKPEPKLQAHVEGEVLESETLKDGTRVIKKMKLTGVSIGKKPLKAKERHAVEKRKKTRRSK